MKFKTYDNRDFTNPITLTRKIDGVRAIKVGDIVLSRKGKPLHNIPPEYLKEGASYEIYCGDFDTTSALLRTKESERKITPSEIYELTSTNERLRLYYSDAYTPSTVVRGVFDKVIAEGDEGLIIYEHTSSGDVLYKMKQIITYDVKVTGVQEGKGKHAGRMGALLTAYGKIGTGFTDTQRQEIWEVGDLIEVECMEITKDKKFRHPRFIRRRFDKDTESVI